MRSCKKYDVPVGIGAHRLEPIVFCEREGLTPTSTSRHSITTVTGRLIPQTNRQFLEMYEDRNRHDHDEYHDNMFCHDHEETVEFMQDVKVPWIAFKVLAAGAIPPEEGFQYAFRLRRRFRLCWGCLTFRSKKMEGWLGSSLPNPPAVCGAGWPKFVFCTFWGTSFFVGGRYSAGTATNVSRDKKGRSSFSGWQVASSSREKSCVPFAFARPRLYAVVPPGLSKGNNFRKRERGIGAGKSGDVTQCGAETRQSTKCISTERLPRNSLMTGRKAMSNGNVTPSNCSAHSPLPKATVRIDLPCC